MRLSYEASHREWIIGIVFECRICVACDSESASKVVLHVFWALVGQQSDVGLGRFGEFLAWITVANLILEYILANAAVIRGFSP
jgi:hypothetical protein